MTPRYFAAVVKAHDERQRIRFDLQRVQTFLICAPNLKKHATLARFWPSPWDAPPQIQWQPIDPAILANFNAQADYTLAEMNKKNGVN